MFNEDDYKGLPFIQVLTCKIKDKAGIPDRWILLDSQSKIDVIYEQETAEEYSRCKKVMLE